MYLVAKNQFLSFQVNFKHDRVSAEAWAGELSRIGFEVSIMNEPAECIEYDRSILNKVFHRNALPQDYLVNLVKLHFDGFYVFERDVINLCRFFWKWHRDVEDITFKEWMMFHIHDILLAVNGDGDALIRLIPVVTE